MDKVAVQGGTAEQKRAAPGLTIGYQLLRQPIFISLVLFALALLPRLPDLGHFLTADEFLWVDRSRNFLAGLTNPAFECTTPVETRPAANGLACTLRTGHPGVTTMWTGSFGLLLRWLQDGRPAPLHDYVTAVSTNPLDASFIAPERLGTTVLVALWVVAVYWLARRLFGAPIALLGAIFIALDPFHVALSRVIHHDALSTMFMTLSVFCAFIYWGEGKPETRRRGWLAASGAMAGLGFLSKSPALYLMPFIALTGLWFFVQEWQRQRQTSEVQGSKRSLTSNFSLSNFVSLILDGLLWFGVAIAAVFICWPAMWVVPLEAIQTVLFVGSKYAAGGHAKGNFFFGTISKDPGPLFYPATWLYRTTPPVLVGVVVLLLAWVRQHGKIRADEPADGIPRSPIGLFATPALWVRPFLRYLPLLLLFILGYYLLMTMGEKKQDRYFLPVYPWLNLMAAAGWVVIGRWLAGLWSKRGSSAAARLTFPALLLLALLGNGYLTAANFPYYFTYYNPLLGGIQGAAKAITIGWGEGLDQAAIYLNQKRDPANTRVASWYESTFAPFYHGPSLSYSKEKGKVLAGDYAIFYINQTQRRYPDDALFDYFDARFEPEKVITLHGLDYAWIYPSLGVDHYIQDQVYTGIASLLAWQWRAGDAPLAPGRPAEFELYWEYLGKRPDEAFFLRLLDGQARLWAEALSRPAAENPPVEQWREGEIILERGELTLPLDIPPGRYRLQIGFYTQAPAVTEGELLFTIPDQEALVTVTGQPAEAAAYRLPAQASPVGRPLGNALTLLGAAWPADSLLLERVAGVTFPVDLYWRVEEPLSADYALHAGLMDAAGTARQAWFDLSLAEVIEPQETTWQPGDILHTRWQLDLGPEVPAGVYHLELVLPEKPDEGLAFGQIVIEK